MVRRESNKELVINSSTTPNLPKCSAQKTHIAAIKP
jgi:hypothetical protein